MKNAWQCLLVLSAVAAMLVYCALPRLGGRGTTEYFKGTTSSAERVEIRRGLCGLSDVLSVKAENVFCRGECRLDEILEKYSARVVFKEQVGEVVSYYCRATRLSGGITLGGERINLHVAVAPYGYTIGTPIICGAF